MERGGTGMSVGPTVRVGIHRKPSGARRAPINLLPGFAGVVIKLNGRPPT